MNNEIYDKIENLEKELEKYKRYVDETFLYSYEELQDKVINLQEKYNDLLEKIDNATNYYLKELKQSVYVDDVAVKMFNILEGNI